VGGRGRGVRCRSRSRDASTDKISRGQDFLVGGCAGWKALKYRISRSPFKQERPRYSFTDDGSFVVLGHALDHSVRGHGRRVPEPHHASSTTTPSTSAPRRGAAAPSRTQLCVAHGGAPRCRRLEDQPWRVVVSIPGARSFMQPLVLLSVRHLNSRSS